MSLDIHERLVLDHVADDDYIVCTPDRDIFVSSFQCRTQMSFRLRTQQGNRLPPGVAPGQVYGLPRWSQNQLDSIRADGFEEANAERGRGGVGAALPPVAPGGGRRHQMQLPAQAMMVSRNPLELFRLQLDRWFGLQQSLHMEKDMGNRLMACQQSWFGMGRQCTLLEMVRQSSVFALVRMMWRSSTIVPLCATGVSSQGSRMPWAAQRSPCRGSFQGGAV